MRKVVVILICVALVSVAVFSFTKQDTSDQNSPPSVSTNASGEVEQQEVDQNNIEHAQPNQFHNANLLNVDFIDLQSVIYETVGTKRISAPFMYETYPIDIFFLPTGEITQCRMCLWAFDSEIGGDYVISEYQSSGLPGTASFDIACTKPSQHFAKEQFDFDFSGLENLTSWIGNTDIKAILDQYVSDIPYGYRLVMGPILTEIIDSQQVSYTALDLSSGSPTEINLSSLSRIPDIYWLEYDSSPNYYALLPYYPATEKTGCKVPLNQPFDGVMDYSAPDGGEYSLNNIVLMFPNGVN